MGTNRIDACRVVVVLIGVVGLATLRCMAGDAAQWGQAWTRNMVSNETHLPVQFDPESGDGIKWSAALGGQAFGSPVIAKGHVLIGANNQQPRDPRITGDHGVLLCLDEADGSFQWQLIVPRLQGDNYLDQPRIAICSPPTVEQDRVYVVTNRAEVACLDLNGMRDGNDGPYRDEGRHMVLPGKTPIEPTSKDADILWLYDMPAEVGIHPHDSAHSSILIDGRYLYLNTGNGVDNTHRVIRSPNAPSLIVLDKATGRLVASDNERIGPRIFHCTWSSPSMAVVHGQKLIFFCGGDGVCYAFRALPQDRGSERPTALQRVWRFDCDPNGPKENVHQYIGNHRTSPSNIMGMPVFYRNRIYVTGGGDFWWGKNEAWLKCIDATGTGDVTGSAQLWSVPLQRHACTTPAIYNGLVFVGDCRRTVYCIDADSGKIHWQQAVKGDVWGSPLAADGKVYVGTYRSGAFWVFAATRNKKVLASTQFDTGIAATPMAANGVLYVNTLTRLYAIGK